MPAAPSSPTLSESDPLLGELADVPAAPHGLLELIAKVPDPRKPRGKRHALAGAASSPKSSPTYRGLEAVVGSDNRPSMGVLARCYGHSLQREAAMTRSVPRRGSGTAARPATEAVVPHPSLQPTLN